MVLLQIAVYLLAFQIYRAVHGKEQLTCRRIDTETAVSMEFDVIDISYM